MIIQNLSGSNAPAPLPSDGPIVSSASPAPGAPTSVPAAPGAQAQGSGSPQPNGSQPPSAQSEAQVKAAVASLNQSAQFLNRGVTFSIDQSTKETVVKVVESGTGTVIKQIPSQQVLAIAQAIDAMQQGMLHQQKT
ncbi:MAG: flagellar protein FlaG [Betaproteobacteria bacterium]|nr:flagellar protein FlaG [Betaproteobacteria bacterium]